MAHDADLDRLKVAQDNAFQRKQATYQAQQTAWEKRSAARDEMNRAHDAKQHAFVTQDSTWQVVARVRANNGPLIDSLNARQETAYQNMVRAFEMASAAHGRRDGASARMYADQGQRFKAESQGYVAERRRLVAEIRYARDAHNAAKPAFQQAKARFDSAKRVYERAKAEHERAQADFKYAKDEFNNASKAFKDRLQHVRDASARRKADKRSVAQQAGVPYQFLDNVWVSTDLSGIVNIYFGGLGSPNGPGHGHYAMDRTGKVTYRRDPYDAHGAHNFTDNQHDYTQLVGRESQSGEFGFGCRFRGYDAYVETGVDNRTNRGKIDIYYGPNGPFGPGHHHAVAYRDNPFEFVSDELR